MEAFGLLGAGFATALSPLNLALAVAGAFTGTVVGALPGIGPVNAIALLLPLVYALKLPATSALILMAATYYGGGYGGRIAAILLNVPGDPSSVMTTLDGYPMARRGEGARALAITAIGSFVGGTGAVIMLTIAAPTIARAGLAFGPAEYVALIVLAIAAAAGIGGGSAAKALAAGAIGLLIATVGVDSGTGIERFTFGVLEFLDGVDFTVVVIGLFAVAEVLELLERRGGAFDSVPDVSRGGLRLADILYTFPTMLRSAASGFVIGVLPGAGATLATPLAYAMERRIAGPSGTFGKGDIRGVAAPETADNASHAGSMIPMLALGIPGSATTAVMMGALMLYDITPGPLLFRDNAPLVWGLIASMYVANVVLLVLNLPLIRFFVRMLLIPPWVLYPLVIALAFAGVWAVNNSVLDLLLATFFGVAGWAARKAGMPLVPLLLGMVLGRMLEDNVRRAMALSDGDLWILVSSPLSAVLWVAAVGVLLWPAVAGALRARRGQAAA
ncbi:tripartite tricarboxylate transporter permease [Elioraea sp.]|uniref:tripartite tricarboxylate transporter permease n=1 Tax=Elioraea sp. TaxID=2185103 RepID=UPI0025BCC1BD|nr:tripartite tricarboxylate transporter permease [Elioraea sp.]